MIKLHQFVPAFGLPNVSPFCMKVETWLRMAGLPYECPRGADLRKAPKGKFPYIEDDGVTLADSGFIIEYLTAKYHITLDAHLSPRQRGEALALQRLFEEHLYWVAVYSRWIEDAGFARTREAFFARFPFPMRQLVPVLARRAMRRQLHGHGMGRHGCEEIYALGCRDVAAIADTLGDRAFLMGEQPSSIDAVGYAFLANLLWAPLPSPLLDEARRHANLEAYCQRMKGRYYA
jgi:glutathione S-transferase